MPAICPKLTHRGDFPGAGGVKWREVGDWMVVMGGERGEEDGEEGVAEGEGSHEEGAEGEGEEELVREEGEGGVECGVGVRGEEGGG